MQISLPKVFSSLLLLVLFSAGTFAIVYAQGEKPPWVENLICNPDDQKFHGIEYCIGKYPYANAHVVVVDLQATGIRLEYIIADGYNKNNNFGECKDVNRASKQLGGPGCDAAENRSYYPVMGLEEARAKLSQAVVVINSDYGAGTQKEPASREHGPEGFTVVRGQRLDGTPQGDKDNNAVNRPWLAVGESAQNGLLQAGIHILGSDNGSKWDWIYTGVGGGPWLIHNHQTLGGVLTDCTLNYSGSCYNGATQTAVATSGDKRWLFFVIMTNVSEDLHELTNFLANSLDVEEAIKFDGGGSSQLWYGGLPTGNQTVFSGDRKLSQYLGIIALPGSGIDIQGKTSTPSPFTTPTNTPAISQSLTPTPTPSTISPPGPSWWEQLLGIFRSDTIDGFGIGSNTHLIVGVEDHNLQNALESQQALGIHWSREQIFWEEVESSQDQFRWKYAFEDKDRGNLSVPRDFDLLTSELKQHNIHMLAVLGYGPEYTTVPVSDEVLVERWRNYVQHVVDRYGEKIDYWEIGNEMNSREFWGKVIYPNGEKHFENPNPQLYAQLLIAAYEVIKSHDSKDMVLLGGLVTVTDDDCATNPFVYLKQLYEAGAWQAFDAIAFHPYWGEHPPEAFIDRGIAHDPTTGDCRPSQRETSNLIGEIRALRTLAQAFGDKPIWVTEIGWSSDWLSTMAGWRGTTSDQVEADLITRTYVPLLSEQGVDVVFWFSQYWGDPPPEYDLAEPGQRGLHNLSSLLTGSEPLGQFQGQNDRGQPGDDDVYEYRFLSNDHLVVITWKARGGGVPRQSLLQDLPGSEALLYWADTADLSPKAGQYTSVNGGQITLDLTERPVILLFQRPNWFEIQNMKLQRAWRQSDLYKRWQELAKMGEAFRQFIDDFQQLLRNITDPNWWSEQLPDWLKHPCGAVWLPGFTVVGVWIFHRRKHKDRLP